MLITVPASAHGSSDAASVLDLEPFLAWARQCHPDAVSLMPPLGPDDQPNGAALLAMRDRLDAEGIRVVAGTLEIPEDAPVLTPGWQMELQFEARALIASLGEADVAPLTLSWRAPCGDPAHRQAMTDVLSGLADEAARAEVRLALQARMTPRDLGTLLRTLDSEWLGVSCHVAGYLAAGQDIAQQLRFLGDRLFAMEVSHPASAVSGARHPSSGRDGIAWPAIVQVLGEIGFSGPFLIRDLGTPLEYAHALGYFRGLLAART